jgi:hypothetical protein
MKISSYTTDNSVNLGDKLIGTDVDNMDVTKNFTISSIVSLANANIEATQVLYGYSTNAQAPSSLNTSAIVEFGPAQGTVQDDVMLLSGGKIIFNKAGLYFVNGYGSVERQGSSGGTAILLFRGVLNNVQATSTKAFHLDTPNVSTPYEITIPFQANAGDVFQFEIMRDSSGVNYGGVYPHTNLGGWSNVPSAEVIVWKIG